jgi:hypothetical protein
MDFFRKLFGSGASAPSGDRGLYFYVRPKRCKEVLRVRVDPMNELSEDEDGTGYVVRKQVRGASCPFPAELHAMFDLNRKLIEVSVTDGEQVSEAEWRAQSGV